MLARLLVPEDFGIVAMAMSLIAIIEMLTAFNFEAALIQKPAPTRADYSAAWTLNLLLGVGSAIVMVRWPIHLPASSASLALCRLCLRCRSCQ